MMWKFAKLGFLTGAGMSVLRLIATALFGEGLTRAEIAPAIAIPVVMLVLGAMLDFGLSRRTRGK